MKLMHTGKKGFSPHRSDTLIFNEQIKLGELIGELGENCFVDNYLYLHDNLLDND